MDEINQENQEDQDNQGIDLEPLPVLTPQEQICELFRAPTTEEKDQVQEERQRRKRYDQYCMKIEDLPRGWIKCMVDPLLCQWKGPKKAFIKHYAVQHTDPLYKCTQCGTKKHYRSDMIQHCAVHLHYKRFQCKVCLKRLSRKENITSHLITFHQVKSKKEQNERIIKNW